MIDTTKKTDEQANDPLYDEFEKMLLDFINEDPDGSHGDAADQDFVDEEPDTADQYDDDEEPDAADAETDWYARMAATTSPQERHHLMRLRAKQTVASARSSNTS